MISNLHCQDSLKPKIKQLIDGSLKKLKLNISAHCLRICKIVTSFKKISTLIKNQKIISPTKNTPEVILDPKGIIKMTGRLIPENAIEFFNPIDEWISDYFKYPADITTVEIRLEYINSVGSRFLLNLIHKIAHDYLKKNNNKFLINWYYKDEDEDMLEKGRFFSLDLDIPINLIKII